MHAPSVNPVIHSIRPVDLASIDAVGFDLDHTLALYDDQAVNVLAAEETVATMKIRGYSPASLPFEITAHVARGLSMDLLHGNLLKIGADGRVLLARRGADWLSTHDIEHQYRGHNPADEAAIWHVNSPFDAPTLWFFSTLGPSIQDARDAAYAARLLRDIRSSLDESHTRGELKRHIARDMSRFVSPAGSFVERLEHWKHHGKRLFVVTNSDRSFATRVLDHVMGSDWRRLFDIVVTDARKPRFFSDETTHRAPVTERIGDACVLDYGNAAMVERYLGISSERILYAGDNARADVIPSRFRGWKTVQVVAELDGPPQDTPWAGALHHHGAPTWFARTIHDNADAACGRIDAFLALGPSERLAPQSPFYERIVGPEPPGEVT